MYNRKLTLNVAMGVAISAITANLVVISLAYMQTKSTESQTLQAPPPISPAQLNHMSRSYAINQGAPNCNAYIATYCTGCETDMDCWDCILDNGSELVAYCINREWGVSYR